MNTTDFTGMYKNAIWFGSPDEKYRKEGMKVYVYGEYKRRGSSEQWLKVCKGDKPRPYTFGVKKKHIVWLEA